MSANSGIELMLNMLSEKVEQDLKSDILSFNGPIFQPLDNLIREALEWRRQQENLRPRLAVILETDGGYVESAERIVNTLRAFYEVVHFYIPNFAFSAGTVMVMSGDEIFMDYYSVLGPIDPQVQIPGQTGWVPASGYLVWYDRLVEKDRQGTITTVEMQFFMENFHPAELYSFEQALRLSFTLVENWLTEYKFGSSSEYGQQPKNKLQQKAKDIAEKLGDTEEWLSHRRGIPMKTLNGVLDLGIKELRAQDPQGSLLTYWRLFADYVGKRAHNTGGAVHVHGRYAAN